MKITIYGAGYVGLVTGVCFAELGHDVMCMDVDQAKIAALQKGEVPIYEPGLTELLQTNLHAGKIKFTTDLAAAVEYGFLQFIAVGTPSDAKGAADLQYVYAVAKNIGQTMTSYKIVVNKSTVPLGTAEKVRHIIQTELKTRGAEIKFDMVSNPEFLKEGAAIEDFMYPDRVVIGADNPAIVSIMYELYAPVTREDAFISMDIASAELTKYAANAFLATKISFMNEISWIAERFGADIDAVRIGIGSDQRIGPYFLYAGCGFGGSCFPKDVRALRNVAEHAGINTPILSAVEQVNVQQKQVLLNKIQRHFNQQLQNKTIAVWGLAFKPNTNDMREASSQVLIDGLMAAGARIKAYDPIAIHEAQKIYGQHPDITFCETAEAALDNADGLAIVTEWQEFRHSNLTAVKEKLREPVIFDGRNLYDPARMKEKGFTYYAIGRGDTV